MESDSDSNSDLFAPPCISIINSVVLVVVVCTTTSYFVHAIQTIVKDIQQKFIIHSIYTTEEIARELVKFFGVSYDVIMT